ncbi:hypothetical protein ANN_10555 [Periplaneta americana]|uniref:Uncharacterized protein n=1 Tax=Periplaneta americana TaxID=6978 RepID=A0ABQ8TR84_PERAM|nr:hypothetical protein ANN_10555 [Periplaneta americana]
MNIQNSSTINLTPMKQRGLLQVQRRYQSFKGHGSESVICYVHILRHKSMYNIIKSVWNVIDLNIVQLSPKSKTTDQFFHEEFRAVASWSKASYLGLALRNALWFVSYGGKKFSQEISLFYIWMYASKLKSEIVTYIESISNSVYDGSEMVANFQRTHVRRRNTKDKHDSSSLRLSKRPLKSDYLTSLSSHIIVYLQRFYPLEPDSCEDLEPTLKAVAELLTSEVNKTLPRSERRHVTVETGEDAFSSTPQNNRNGLPDIDLTIEQNFGKTPIRKDIAGCAYFLVPASQPEVTLRLHRRRESAAIQRTADFLGLNYYTAYLAKPSDERPSPSMHRPPIVPHSPTSEWLSTHLVEILKAMYLDSIRVIGYTVWSLIDSYEWFGGYTTKFGLFHVNFTDPARSRIPKKSAFMMKEVLATRRVPDKFYELDNHLAARLQIRT